MSARPKTPDNESLAERLSALETQLQPSVIRTSVEDVVANSPFFRLGKRAAYLVAILVVVLFFGGEILSGVKIQSVDEKAENAKKLVSDAAKNASDAIERKQKEIADAAKTIEDQKLALEKLVSSAEGEIFGDARERVMKSAGDVETKASAATQSITQAKDNALRTFDADTSTLRESLKSTQDKRIQELQTNIGAANTSLESSASNAKQSIQQSKDAATKSIEDQVVAARTRLDSTRDQLLKDTRTNIVTAQDSVKTIADQAISVVQNTRDSTLKRLDSSDISSLPQIKDSVSQLKRQVEAISLKTDQIRLADLRIIFGKFFTPLIICIGLGPILGLVALAVASKKHKPSP